MSEDTNTPPTPNPEEEPRGLVAMAHANIAFTALAILTLVVTIKTDNVPLFGLVALFSIIALAAGFMRRCDNRLIEGLTFLGMVFSGLMAFFGLAFVFIFVMWDANL